MGSQEEAEAGKEDEEEEEEPPQAKESTIITAEEEERSAKWRQSFVFLLATLQKEWGVDASLSRIPQNQ